MYSDWEQRSASAEEGEGVVAEVDGHNRELALREPLTQLTTGIISGSVVRAHVEILIYTSWWCTITFGSR